jgi:hypothetical protein
MCAELHVFWYERMRKSMLLLLLLLSVVTVLDMVDFSCKGMLLSKVSKG